jgi:hypothetical protein
MRACALLLFALQRVSPGAAQPLICTNLPTKPIQVITTADATALAALAACPGAKITAIWHGSVVLSAPIVIGDTTSLSISAAPGSLTEPIIDGNNATQLFQVQGELQLRALTLQHGFDQVGLGGGAVYASPKSQVTSQGCSFKQNSAVYGAAICGEAGAVVLLQEVTTVGSLQ